MPFESPPSSNFQSVEKMTILESETGDIGPSLVWYALSEVRTERSLGALADINRFVHSLPSTKMGNMENILTRDIDQIIEEGVIGGCHDFSIAFAGLARAAGFPVKFVESADVAFLNDRERKGKYGGHSFLKIYIHDYNNGEGKWVLVDPTMGVYYENDATVDNCLPGRHVKIDEQGEYMTCDRIKMYEVQNLWDVGFGSDSLRQCLRIFHKGFQDAQDFSNIIFRPIHL
jgi:hypothetical protein